MPDGAAYTFGPDEAFPRDSGVAYWRGQERRRGGMGLAAASQPTQTARVEARRRTLTLLACCFSLFMALLDSTVVNVALPSIQRHFHASFSELQWVVDAYILVLASLLLLSGSSGDRFGRRRVFQIGLVVFCLGSLLCSLAWSLPVLTAFRMLQAVGGSMLTPTTLSIITNTFREPRERAAAIGIWGGVSGLSVAAGPVIGGLLVQAVDWRAVFWVNLPIGAIAFAMAALFITESRAPRARRPDLPGQALAVLFLAALTYGLIEGPGSGWGTARILAVFAVAVSSLAAFLVVESRSAQPLLDLRFFRNPSFTGAAAIAVLAFTVLTGYIFLNTLYLQEVRGFTPLQAGLYTLPATALIAVVSPLSGLLTGRFGPRLPIALAGLFLFGGMLLLQYSTPVSPFVHLLAAYAMVGLGSGLVNPPITNAAVSAMPREQAGAASAVAGTARNVGSTLGVALLGSIATSRFAVLLAGALGAAHVPSAVAARVVAQAGAGAAAGREAHVGGALGPLVNRAVGDAFTGSLHAGYLVASAAAVGVVALAMWTMGRPRAPA